MPLIGSIIIHSTAKYSPLAEDFLVDHPCLSTRYKETDPYPVDALPTCDHAQDVCGRDKVTSGSH